MIRAVIELDTRALDIPRLIEKAGRFYEPVFGTDTQKHMAVSPYHNIKENRYTPPFLFVVANNNEARRTQSKRMSAQLREVGVYSKVLDAPDRTHGTLNRWLGGVGDQYGSAVIDFYALHAKNHSHDDNAINTNYGVGFEVLPRKNSKGYKGIY